MLYSLSHYLYFPGHVHLHPFCNPPYHRTYARHLCKWGTCITKSDCLIQSLPKKTCLIQEQLFWSTVCLKNLYEWNRAIVLGVGLDNPYQVLRFHSFESWLWLCNLCKSFPSKGLEHITTPTTLHPLLPVQILLESTKFDKTQNCYQDWRITALHDFLSPSFTMD